ncbi:MAG: VIT1/CCC1 transporter family protein [Deltaproteobacteria bacterium]|nr:VIT1/CCC1 transporter family protein [Candidatus Zymogenaceae bacterium]
MTEELSKINRRIIALQKDEATEHIIYQRLARTITDTHNREILSRIAEDEKRHYDFWRKISGRDVGPGRLRVLVYYAAARILGITFALKLLELGERNAQIVYETLSGTVPGLSAIIADENEHEHELVDLIDEHRLHYVGSIVLGLSDALVELTGTLAGFTLALKDTRIIAAAGLITGVAAALSMAASEYQSTRSEGDTKNPVKASLYTGAVYILTVALLIVPYLLLGNPAAALGITMSVAMAIILFFTFYISVASSVPFLRRFFEMAVIVFGVASLSFFIGWAIKAFFNITI